MESFLQGMKSHFALSGGLDPKPPSPGPRWVYLRSMVVLLEKMRGVRDSALT
jgi:hypothetical protein